MPTAEEELLSFLPHGNTQIRQLAVENLAQCSLSQPLIFKKNQLLPVKNLMVLVRDYKQIAHNALIILINLSTDHEILEFLCSHNDFLHYLISRLSNSEEPNTSEFSMLLANLGKHEGFKKLILTNSFLQKETSAPGKYIDYLLDLFVKDTATLLEGRKHMLSKQNYDQIIPLSKLVVFTSHKSQIRRQGVASTIKNVSFETGSHKILLNHEDDGINLLPYLLLPLMGGEEYNAEDSEGMIDECQLLSTTKQREPDLKILKTHLETLLLLTTTRDCRDYLRKIKLYPIIRELHQAVPDEDISGACDRLVQVLMRDEEDSIQDFKEGCLGKESKCLGQIEEDDYKIVEV